MTEPFATTQTNGDIAGRTTASTADLTLAQIATLLNMIAADIHVQTALLHALIKERGLNTDDVDGIIAYRDDIVERMQTALMAIQDDLDDLADLAGTGDPDDVAGMGQYDDDDRGPAGTAR